VWVGGYVVPLGSVPGTLSKSLCAMNGESCMIKSPQAPGKIVVLADWNVKWALVQGHQLVVPHCSLSDS